MKRTKLAIKNILVFLISVSVTLTCMPVNMTTLASYAEETATETTDTEETEHEIIKKATYEIKDEKDWMNFAEDCRLDEWSLGRTVILLTDIDLSSYTDFMGVPSFCGEFNGNGHTIKGFCLTGGTESVGLFRYLEKEGTIKNLKVEGEINSTDYENKVGGIVGINAGKLQNCSFNGIINAKGITGGLAGYNGTSGTISKCSVNGHICSSHSVGGACGENRGIVSETISNADVNSDSSWFEDDESNSNVTLSLYSIASTTKELVKKGSDIGGIAGFSDGIIAGCKNNGIVGYQHTGRNVGGIAGRQSGTIIDSENNGKVYGKQDVGGIVGQFEPKTTQEESVALTAAVNKLHDDIETMVNDMDKMSDVITDDIGQMTDTAESASHTTEAITNELRDVIEKNVEVVNDLAGRVDYVCDHLPDVLDNLDDSLDAMSQIGEDLKKISEDLDIISKLDEGEYDPAQYNRLSLNYGQGGSLSTSITNPEEGESVTITVNTDSCYELKSLTMTLYQGDETDITSQVAEGKYTFTMPADNVSFKAVFSYTGQYYASSNPGGRVSFDGDDSQMTIKAIPGIGYSFAKLYVGESEIVTTEETGIYSATVAREKSGKPIKVQAVFSKRDVSDNDVSGTEIVTSSSTGGTLLASNAIANPGDEITFVVASDTKYTLSSLCVNGENLTSEVSSGTLRYTIPDGIKRVEAEAVFEPIMVVITGEVGGNATYTVSGDKVTVRINTQTGYILKEPLSLAEEDGTEILYEKASANSISFSFTVTNGMKNGSAAYLHLQYSLSNSSEIVHEAKNRISENVKIFNDSMNRISEINTRLNEIMDDGNGGTKDFSDLTDAEQEEVNRLLKELSDEMVTAGTAAAQIMTDLNTVIEIMGPYAEEAIRALSDDLDSLSKHYSALTKSLQAASKSVRSIVTYLNALDDLQFVNLSEDFNKNTEKLSVELNQIISIMKKLNNDTNHYTDVLEEDMNRVNDQLNVVFNLLIERVNNLENLIGEDLIEDHSADPDSEYESSVVSSSVNNSVVNGDSNVGGIAGSISRDGDEADSDSDEATEAGLGSKYLACAKLNSCTNNGFVTIRKENGGGIVGNMSLGYVKDCTGKGSVYSSSASVIGGIAGYSEGTIENCNSSAQLSGSEYIGGIAGKANTIKGCLSMAYISSYDAIVGAISGAYLPAKDESDDISSYHTSLKKNYSNNYYVSSILYGIDEVSYASVAEPVDYTRMLKISNRNQAFSSLEVIFLDEEENVVSRQKVKYGESIDVIEYPAISAEDGGYFEWEGISSETIEGNLILRALSTANVVVLEGSKNNEGKIRGYAEGTFTTRAQLLIIEKQLEDKELPSLPENASYIAYSVSIENSNLNENDETKLRLLSSESGEKTVYKLTEQGWVEIESKNAGKYEEVILTGTEGTFLVVSVQKTIPVLTIVLAVVGIIVLAGLVTLLVVLAKRKKKHKNNKNVTQE